MTEETNTSFFVQLNDTFFARYGRYFSSQSIKKNAHVPFKDHSQIIILTDILSRKNNHHAILHNNFPAKLHSFFIDAFLQNLAFENVPYALRDAELIYLEIDNLTFTNAQQVAISKDFEAMYKALHDSNKYLLIALTQLGPLLKDAEQSDSGFLSRQFDLLLNHPKCRFLVFSNENIPSRYIDKHFNYLQLGAPTEADIAAILKHQRTDLESYHHVLIPDEILLHAYALSERYLSTKQTLAKTLELLDSSAARTAATERIDNNPQSKPVVTTNVLTSVLSSWTQIPASHLQTNKFKLSEFIHGMQQRIFGQDTAINILACALQQVQARLQHHNGPFCSFLFAGPEHSGKKTTAIALAEQLFKQLNVLYFAQAMPATMTTLLDIKLKRCTDKQHFALTDVIATAPYAIIVFEQIDQASPAILDQIYRILHTGLLCDENGNQYDFHQSIIILNTTRGIENLIETQSTIQEELPEHIDLMQLVMNEQKYANTTNPLPYSPEELVDDVIASIKMYFSESLCEQFKVIPFLPLNKSAVEKIIHQKIKMLGKLVDSRYGIELGYAIEVIRYLANEVLMQKNENYVIDIDKGLKQLYFVVEQAILSQADNKQRPAQLFLQLNETGQSLRCDWLIASAIRQHAVK